MKACLTSWKMWAGVSVLLVVLLVVREGTFASVLPFMFVLICPLMMIFMMKNGHNHNDKEKGGEKHA